jgi:hypothetical protein
MPRSLSAALQTQVSSTATKTAFLVELNLSSTIRLTDWYSDVTYDSNTMKLVALFLQLTQQLKQVNYKLMKSTLVFPTLQIKLDRWCKVEHLQIKQLKFIWLILM